MHTSGKRAYVMIAGMFWLHVAFMLYSGCAPACSGPPESMVGYAVLCFVLGWTSFLLTVTCMTVVPRVHWCKTLMAVSPTVGVAVWGAWILHSSLDRLPWPTCSTSRVSVVGAFCALQVLQLSMVFVVCLLRTLLPGPAAAPQTCLASLQTSPSPIAIAVV